MNNQQITQGIALGNQVNEAIADQVAASASKMVSQSVN